MKWFKRHLNWTVILIPSVSFIILLILFTLASVTVSDKSMFDNIGVSLFFLGVLINFITWGWYLKEKGRSLLYLLLLPIPLGIGAIFFLCLTNKKESITPISGSKIQLT